MSDDTFYFLARELRNKIRSGAIQSVWELRYAFARLAQHCGARVSQRGSSRLVMIDEAHQRVIKASRARPDLPPAGETALVPILRCEPLGGEWQLLEMPLAPGHPLVRLTTSNQETQYRVYRLLAQALDGLLAQGIAYGDVSPGNAVLDRDTATLVLVDPDECARGSDEKLAGRCVSASQTRPVFAGSFHTPPAALLAEPDDRDTVVAPSFAALALLCLQSFMLYVVSDVFRYNYKSHENARVAAELLVALPDDLEEPCRRHLGLRRVQAQAVNYMAVMWRLARCGGEFGTLMELLRIGVTEKGDRFAAMEALHCEGLALLESDLIGVDERPGVCEEFLDYNIMYLFDHCVSPSQCFDR